jgi:hypothetical protein
MLVVAIETIHLGLSHTDAVWIVRVDNFSPNLCFNFRAGKRSQALSATSLCNIWLVFSKNHIYHGYFSVVLKVSWSEQTLKNLVFVLWLYLAKFRIPYNNLIWLNPIKCILDVLLIWKEPKQWVNNSILWWTFFLQKCYKKFKDSLSLLYRFFGWDIAVDQLMKINKTILNY